MLGNRDLDSGHCEYLVFNLPHQGVQGDSADPVAQF
jgi:hypothetical protein